MKSKLNLKENKGKVIGSLLLTVIIGMIAGYSFDLTIRPTEEKVEQTFSIELAEDQGEKALIETEEGEIEIDTVNVVAVDGNQLIKECGEDEECGRGWWVDTSSPTAFKDAVLGQCIDFDGYYGSQCYDLGALFWSNVTDRYLSTCGTGAAKGIMNCYEYNAGTEFEMVWNAEDVQAGDWLIFGNGQFGHIGMALGGYNNGYVALLGTNQGGSPCNGGGSSANIINISLDHFTGAFRYKKYIKEEPSVPALPISNCVLWHVEHGDTMSKIMMECEGTIKYGEIMNEYAKTWYSLIYKPGQSVYDGWQSESGVGLYANDDIEHRL